jgi:MFS family permease
VSRSAAAGIAGDTWTRAAVVGVFFVHGLLFASWTAHIPFVKEHLGLDDGSLGVVLLGAPIGSVLAIVMAGRLLPVVGSRRLVQITLVGYCLSGPILGLSGSKVSFFLALAL